MRRHYNIGKFKPEYLVKGKAAIMIAQLNIFVVKER